MAGAGMSRILGIGFLVGAKDEGATETFEEVTTSSDKMADSIDRVGVDAPKSLDRFNTSLDSLSGQMGALTTVMGRAVDRGFDRVVEGQREAADAAENLGRKTDGVNRFRDALQSLEFLRLGRIADTLDQIADAAGVGVGAQSTALESFGAQFGQTYRQATAGMGRFQGLVDEVRGQVSGVAFSLQIGAEQMLQPITQLASQGRRLEDFGITVRQLGGAIQAGIIDSATFGQGLTELTQTYGMSEEAAGGLLDRITAIGESFGIGRAAVAAFPQALEAIRPLAARFPEIEQNAGAAVESMVRLGSAIQMATGTDSQAAMGQATAIMQRLGESRGGLQDLITGLGSEFDTFVEQLAIGAGSVDEAISMAMQDPARFAMSMARLMQQEGETSVMGQRLASTLNELSPGLLQLVRSGGLSAEAMDAMVRPVENAEGAFGRMAQAASGSTRTFSEQLELMRDAFTTRLNAIGRATDRDFLPRQARAYRQVGDTIARFAADDGPLGMLTRGFLRVRTFGLVQGLLPQLGALTAGFGDSVAAAAPFISVIRDTGLITAIRGLTAGTGAFATGLRGLGFVLTRFILPVTLAAGAIYLLYRYWDRIPGIIDSVQERMQSAADWFSGIGARFSQWVKEIDWAKMGRQIVDRLFAAISGATEAIFGGGANGSIGRAIWNGLVAIFSGLGTMISGLATSMWQRFSEGLEVSGRGTVGTVQRYINNYFRYLRVLFEGVTTVITSIVRVVAAPFQAMWRVFSRVGILIANVFANGQTGGEGFAGVLDLVTRGTSWLISGLEYVSDVLNQLIDDAADFYVAIFEDAFAPIIDALDRDLPFLQQVFTTIFQDMQSTVADMGYAFEEVGAVMSDWWNNVAAPIVDIATRTFDQFFGNTETRGRLTYQHLGAEGVGMWNVIKRALRTSVVAFANVFNFIVRRGSETFQTLATVGYASFRTIEGAVERVRILWEGVQNIMRAGWAAVAAETRQIIGNMVSFVGGAFDALIYGWQVAVLDLRGVLLDVAGTIFRTLNGIVSAIPQSLVNMLPQAARTMFTQLRTTVDDYDQTMAEHNRDVERRRQQLDEQYRLDQEARRREEQTRVDQSTAMWEQYGRVRANVNSELESSNRRQTAEIQGFTVNMANAMGALRRGTQESTQAMAEIGAELFSGRLTRERLAAEMGERVAGAAMLRGRMEESLRNLPPDVRAQLERAIQLRGTATTGEAFSERDIERLVGWAQQIPAARGREGRARRAEALTGLMGMISGEEAITAPPTPVTPPARRGGRGAAHRAALERTAVGAPEAPAIQDVRIREVDPSLRGTATVQTGGGPAAPSGRGAAAAPTEMGPSLEF